MDLANAHVLFAPDSLGLVWNDAQWDPAFLKRWWPLLKKDGGLLLLHNVIGNGARQLPNFDIIYDHFSRLFQPHITPHAPWHMPC